MEHLSHDLHPSRKSPARDRRKVCLSWMLLALRLTSSKKARERKVFFLLLCAISYSRILCSADSLRQPAARLLSFSDPGLGNLLERMSALLQREVRFAIPIDQGNLYANAEQNELLWWAQTADCFQTFPVRKILFSATPQWIFSQIRSVVLSKSNAEFFSGKNRRFFAAFKMMLPS